MSPLLLSLSSFLTLGCSSELSCGDGTHQAGDECVADAVTTPLESDTETDTDTDTDTDADTDTPVDKRVIGYFAEWAVYDRDYHVWDIPVANLTHLNYAFADATVSGGCEIYDSWAALDKDGGNFQLLSDLRDANPHLKTLISLGGWTLSGEFSDIAATAQGRNRFAADCVDFMVTHGFDGIDVDWEYPGGGGLDGNAASPDDTENFTLLLQALRDELDSVVGPSALLTIAGPGGASKIANIQVAEVGAVVDWINVMAYDFHGGWELTTGFNAPLYPASDSVFSTEDEANSDAAMQAWLAAGVPSDKLVMGAPTYGRGWSGVGSAADGLFQSATGSPMGTWEAGSWSYQDLVDNYIGQPGWTRSWHEESLVPWLYNADRGIFITYDDTESLGHKLDYILDEDLGGIMFWELSEDTADHALSGLMAERLRP